MPLADPPWPPPVNRVRRYRNIIVKAACNLRCTYCELKKAKVDTAATNASIGLILDRFMPGETLVRVEADGEIGSYPPILDYLAERVRADGYRIEVLTNGTRFPQCIRPELLWVISVDGHTAEMNRERGLTQAQVDVILDQAVALNADLQCVYHGQPLEAMNGFIDELARRGYAGRLHILPLLALAGKPLTKHLDYDRLHKAPFLEQEGYFRHWDYIYQHGRRGERQCDQITNGFNYYVDNDRIEMMKCDSYAPLPRHLTLHGLQSEPEYDRFPCGTCLSNQEYNNCRPQMAM
ncbi:radical SAM protein [Sphingomonas zeae]